MILALLVVAQATAEWVEISQQHYRKPLRTHSSYNPFTTPDKFEVEETTKSWIQNNRTVTEYNWNKAPTRQPNSGNIKRVQYPISSVRPAESIRFEDDISDLDKDEFVLKSQELMKPTAEFNDTNKPKEKIIRVPNIGIVKRVQINNTPVKSPFLTVDNKEKVAKTRYEELPLETELDETEIKEHKRRTETKTNNRRIYVNEIKKQYNEPASTFPTEEEISFTEEGVKKPLRPEHKNRNNIKNMFSSKPAFITETADFSEENKQEDQFHKVSHNTRPRITTESYNFDEEVYKTSEELPNVSTKYHHTTSDSSKHQKIHIFTTESPDFDVDVNQNNEEIPKLPTKYNYKTSDLVKHETVNKFSQPDLDRNKDKIEDSDRRNDEKDYKPDLEKKQKPEKETTTNTTSKKTVPEKDKKDTSKDNKPDNKVANMENLVQLMKVVADTISQNSRRSFGGKMRYLHELKDTILANIADRIDSTWPDDDVPGSHRRSRAAHASPRGHHVHFPSSESALMTISFLTFAVFLIKLVLQVIHTYKNKAMMVAPVMVASAGRAARAYRGRH